MQSFIVRIYRTTGEDQRRIVGVVEKPGVEGKQAFPQYDELWEILNPPEEKTVNSHTKRRSPPRSKSGTE